MANRHTFYRDVEIEIDLEDFDTEDLIEELELRGTRVSEYGDGKELMTEIWQKRRLGQDYQQELDKLLYMGIGKVL